MTSVPFYPHIGGIETVTENLANEFSRRDDIEVKVVTATTEEGDRTFPYEVYRNPDRKTLWRLYRWCDVFVHQGISLKWVWPLFLKRKPWFIVYHQVYYQKGYKGKIKELCSHLSTHNIAVSETTARGYGLKNYTTILNSFNGDYYRITNTAERRDIVFLGKVTKAKGVHILLDAFEKFKDQTGSDYQLTIIGDSGENSSEYEYMKSYASKLKHITDVHFVGPKYPQEIAPILNAHKIQVVPSTYMEAFGVVCLEGMSCGCVVIGSDGDGISEAIHDCGFLMRKGDSDDLCEKMKVCAQLSTGEVSKLQAAAAKWLNELSLENVANRYIKVFSRYIHKK